MMKRTLVGIVLLLCGWAMVAQDAKRKIPDAVKLKGTEILLKQERLNSQFLNATQQMQALKQQVEKMQGDYNGLKTDLDKLQGEALAEAKLPADQWKVDWNAYEFAKIEKPADAKPEPKPDAPKP